jgi:hypothetical protein
VANNNGIRMTRSQLEAVFGNNYESIIQMELLLEQIDTWSNSGLDASIINVDTTNFGGIFSSSENTVQLALDFIDDITTTNLPEGSNLYFTNERVDDRVATLIQNGTGLTWTYVDVSNTLTGNVSLSAFDTDDLAEGGTNLYFTNARVASYISGNILEYGFESVSSSTTVTKTKTVFTGSTASQTITLPTAGTAGREVEVFNGASVEVAISGSSLVTELYPNESACFTDTGSDWLA